MSNLQITLDGFAFPMSKVKSFVEQTVPNESTNQTLDGSIYTDFVNNRRVWEVEFAYLCEDDYDTLRAIYFDMYNTETLPVLVVSSLSIQAPVKLNLSDKDMKLNGTMILGYKITLQEQDAIS